MLSLRKLLAFALFSIFVAGEAYAPPPQDNNGSSRTYNFRKTTRATRRPVQPCDPEKKRMKVKVETEGSHGFRDDILKKLQGLLGKSVSVDIIRKCLEGTTLEQAQQITASVQLGRDSSSVTWTRAFCYSQHLPPDRRELGLHLCILRGVPVGKLTVGVVQKDWNCKIEECRKFGGGALSVEQDVSRLERLKF